MVPFAIFVAFVRCDEERRARLFYAPERFEQMQGPHRIDVERFAGAEVGLADQRLGGQMENKVRFAFIDCLGQNIRLLNVSDYVTEAAGQTQFGKKRRGGWRGQAQAGDVRAEAEQPFAKPRSLETSVARDKNSFPVECGPKQRHGFQIFHGALPSAQRRFNKLYSEKVSIGCQKPSCAKAINCPSRAMLCTGSCSNMTLSALSSR